MKSKKKTNFRLRSSLTIKVIGVVFLVVVILVLFFGVTINSLVSEEITSLVQERNFGMACSIQSEVDAFIKETVNMFELTSKQDIVRAGSRFPMMDLFNKITADYPQFVSMYFASVKGEIIHFPVVEFSPDYDPVQEEWYKKAVTTEGLVIGNLKKNKNDGYPVITLSKSINGFDGKLSGVLGATISLKKFSTLVSDMLNEDNVLSFMVDSKGKLIAHYDHDMVIEGKDFAQVINIDNINKTRADNLQYTFNQTEYLGSYVPLPFIDGTIIVSVPVKQVFSGLNRIQRKMVIIELTILFILVLAVYIVIRRYLLQPISFFTNNIQRVARGDLTVKFDLKRSDEIGQLTKVFNSMVTQLKKIIISIKDAAKMVGGSSHNLKDNSLQVGNMTDQVLSSIEELVSGSDEQANNIEDVNKQIQNLAEELSLVNESNQMVRKLAGSMNLASDRGSKEIKRVKEQMDKIKDTIHKAARGFTYLESASEEIDDILNLINNIAEQTNLLALNAAIEAARAGDAGRGFSVVAEEIRELAVESVKSADRIRDLITDIKQETKAASKRMQEGTEEVNKGEAVVNSAREAFGDISQLVKNVNNGFEKSNEALMKANNNSKRIVENVQNIAGISEEISASSQEVAAASEEQKSSIDNIISLADELASMAENLNKSIDRFNI
ncbi:methyl-accepting chemotaxis protein [Halothermothrix orenii]|uniref:Methyl-accepting chemotaxis sensory transducer n=1 Tax=Halothermothrix orenii (strain H 168 / OCM 544 / DSM 9562) TaxID=373903 RepID=B8CZK2_HALOH|nr:methyl-accepting chemotaxis protein [Halothermothrix orenii]ACL70721.1 methyl-accepting chemotaxis sensory transducer [Halothermothrix orenii H 168]